LSVKKIPCRWCERDVRDRSPVVPVRARKPRVSTSLRLVYVCVASKHTRYITVSFVIEVLFARVSPLLRRCCHFPLWCCPWYCGRSEKPRLTSHPSKCRLLISTGPIESSSCVTDGWTERDARSRSAVIQPHVSRCCEDLSDVAYWRSRQVNHSRRSVEFSPSQVIFCFVGQLLLLFVLMYIFTGVICIYLLEQLEYSPLVNLNK